MYFARKRHYILNSNLKLQTLLFPVGPSMRLRRGQGWGEWGDTGGGVEQHGWKHPGHLDRSDLSGELL